MSKTKNLRVLVINGHVGIPIRNGAIQWWMRRHPLTSLILAQEIRDGAALRRALGPGWSLWPSEQPHEHRKQEAMTYVAYRRSRFKLVGGRNDDITNGESHPRTMTAARLVDRKTGHTITAASVHCAPLGAGLVNGHPVQRARQTKQLTAYADFLRSVPHTDLLLAGGDFNQNLSQNVPPSLTFSSAHHIFRAARMTSAKRLLPGNTSFCRLMELFVGANMYMKVIDRVTYQIPVKGMDHEVVFIKLAITKA